MAKSKESKDEEFYKGRIRELEKTIKSLRKHIRQLEKQRHRWEKQVDEEDYHNIEKIEEVVLDCPKCKKGSLVTLDLGIKLVKTCSMCLWRKTENK